MSADRRKKEIPVAFERRRKEGAGFQPWPRSHTESSRDYNDDEFEFIKAIDTYKRVTGSYANIAWTEVLQILKSLGYRKVAPSTFKGS